MKLRHAAAFALVGWYLMMPPLSSVKSDFTYKDDAPLRLWKIMDSFDTAAECNEFKFEGLKQARDQHNDSLAYAYSEATCIATDDPRLKEK